MKTKRSRSIPAFTILETLIAAAFVGVLSALVIAYYTNAAQNTRRVVASQQQAAVQNAINNWVNSHAQEHGLSATRTAYNNASTSRDRLQLVGNYLNSSTLDHLLSSSDTANANEVRSTALARTNQYLYLKAWSANSSPTVDLQDSE